MHPSHTGSTLDEAFARAPSTGADARAATSRGIVADCAGVVLAGGLSSRMGRPKAWLSLSGEPLLARVVERLRAAFGEVWVVAAADQELPAVDALVTRDRRPRTGPLGGLETALTSVRAGAVFAVSCDVPCLQPALARRMVDLSRGFDLAVPRWGGRLHPLAGVYRRELLPAVTALLDAGRLRPVFLLEERRSRVVEEEDLREADPAGLSFLNVNTPDQLESVTAALPPRIAFELFGQPRVVTGRREIRLDVVAPATVGAALAALAREAPELIGPVLAADGSLPESFLVGLDGRGFTSDPSRPVRDGERLLLLSASAGG